MKPIKLSPDVYKRLQELKRKDIKLFNKIHRQLKLYKQNPRHKSLRLHRIAREVENTWSISVDKGFRMLYTETKEGIYFFRIGTHDEVYRRR